MTISRADERWLDCLDRALAALAGTPMVLDHQAVIVMAQAFYNELPSMRGRRPERIPITEVDDPAPLRVHPFFPSAAPCRCLFTEDGRECDLGREEHPGEFFIKDGTLVSATARPYGIQIEIRYDDEASDEFPSHAYTPGSDGACSVKFTRGDDTWTCGRRAMDPRHPEYVGADDGKPHIRNV